MLPPAGRQVVKQYLVIEHSQVFRTGELDNHVVNIELLGKHRAHIVHYHLFFRPRADIVDGQPAFVDANKKARATHITQLIEHNMAVVNGQ